MKHLTFDTSIEPMISRIPAMFAYLEFNDDGTTTLHPATDSYDGSFGKVIENIALPCGVNLCTYVELEEAPVFQWNASNTYSEGTNIEGQYSISSSEYVRRVDGYSYEETEEQTGIIYTEIDDIPETITNDMPQNVKVAEKDREGNVIVDCNGDKIYKFYTKQTDYSYYKKICLLEEGGTYSYRTLIDYYYRYKDVLPADNSFIQFMLRAIGKFKIDRDVFQMWEDEYPLIPDTIYLAQLMKTIENYKKYHRVCEYYRTHYTNIGQINEKLEKKCEKYSKMGGDRVLRYLESLKQQAADLALEYLCYAENRAFSLNIGLNIPLFQSKNDLGYLSCYLNEFVPGERYKHGELITYDGRTYICILNRYLLGGNNYEYVKCNDRYYRLASGGYDEITFENTLSVVLPATMYNAAMFIIFNNEYYKWDGGHYIKIEMTEYCTGIWNENLELNEFDYQHFILINEYITNDASSIGIPEKVALADADIWYSQDNPYGEHMKLFISMPYLPNHFVYKYIEKNGNFYIWDETSESYISDPSQCLEYEITGRSDSKLKSLRSDREFEDSTNVIQYPNDDEDWLYYYKIGNYYSGRGILWDEYGNIKRFGNTPVTVGNYVTDLIAYGTILTKIIPDTNEHTLTFEYVVNAHLKAKLAEVDTDDDGNVIYKYEPFEYDSNDSHGVLYTETYTYFDPDIDTLISNGDFQAYVEGREDTITDYMINYGYKPFRFSVLSATATMNVFNNEYDYPYVLSEYRETIENNLDYFYQPLFKKDYFVGYPYEPNIENGVNIRRGNGAAFDRHIRLSEVKTLEDLNSYSNGSMFPMMES